MQTKRIIYKMFGPLLIVVMLFAVLPADQVSAQATITVCPVGETCDYHTIQSAIDAASPGDTISVAAGTYSENYKSWVDIELFKSVNLIGAGSGQTIVELTGKQHGLEIRPDATGEVLVQGLTFTKPDSATKSADWGIIIGETGGTFQKVVLRDVEVAYAQARNIALLNATYNAITIENSNFHHSGTWGASARGTISIMTITDSNFDNNGWFDPAHGIGFDIDMPTIVNHLTVVGGTFNNNSSKGINLVQTSNATFENITASNNGGAPGGGFGVSVWEWSNTSSNLTFLNPILTNNATDGFLIGSETGKVVSNVVIEGGTITNNGRGGLFVFRDTGWGEGVIENVSIVGAYIDNIQVIMPYEDLMAIGNWFGTGDPAVVPTKVTSGVVYNPWCYNEACTELYLAAGGSIQDAIDIAKDGDTIHVAAGTYELSQSMIINKNLTIMGEDKTSTFIIPGTGFDNAYMFRVEVGGSLHLSNFTMDGAGFNTKGAVYVVEGGTGVIDNNVIKNMSYGTYVGFGVVAYGDDVGITNNNFSNIQRVGMWAGGNNVVITGNTYTGKGAGDWLDYGIEVGVAGSATITGNTITDCLGVASSDGSVSGGILVSDYYGKPVIAVVQNNTLSNNTYGLLVGYNSTDESQVSASGNTFTNNEYQIDIAAAINMDLSAALTNNTFDKAVYIENGLTIYTTIQEAIAAASAGDTILVGPGTYNEAILVNKALNLVGSGDDVTFIDGTGLADTTLFKSSGLTTGTLDISGFTFRDDPTPDALLEFPVSFSGCQSPAKINFHDNTLIGTGSAEFDWGLLAGYNGSCEIVINNNTFDNIGGNNILIERATGLVEIGFNDFALPTDGGPAIFSMSYGTASEPNTVTGKHWYHDNHFYPKMPGSSIWSGIVVAPAWGNGWDVRQYGTYEDVLIENNIVESFVSVGIQVEVDGSQSTFNGVIQNNVLTAYPDQPYSKGIRLLGPVSNTKLLDNNIKQGLRGIYLSGTYGQPFYPTGITVEGNNLAGNEIGFEEVDTSTDQDISPNWWGSIAGPDTGQVVGNVDYSPWCGDEDCTFLVPTDGVIEIPVGTPGDIVQQYINNAPQGTEIRFLGTPLSYSGGFVINTPHLTIKLMNGTVIENESPCFVINADYTTITTESSLGAVCKPTSGDNAIDVNGDRLNIVIEGLEIDGADGTNGIDFDSVVTDLVIRDNYIHGLAGDGIFFAAQPAGSIEIQGNLLMGNGGNGIEAGVHAVPAQYNAWGHVDGALLGDGASANVDWTNWTHVDLYLESTNPDVDNWANQVFVGETITYEVKANLKNVFGADFLLHYPAELSIASTSLGDFFDLEALTEGTGQVRFEAWQMGEENAGPGQPLSGEDLVLFTVTFTANTAKKDLVLNLDETSDLFSMSPGYGPSSNIYAVALDDITTLDVITRPTLTADANLAGPYVAGLRHEFSTTIANLASGGEWIESLGTTPEPDAIAWIRISDITEADIHSLQFKYGGVWYDFSVQGGTVFVQDGDDLLVRFGNDLIGFDIGAPSSETDEFAVTFINPGTHEITFEIYDMMDTAADRSDDILLTDLGPVTITVDGNYTVTGTVSMQGRSVRSGVPMTLTAITLPEYGPFYTTSTNVISNNVLFTGVNWGTYEVTTTQPRYLNIHEELDIQFDVSGVTLLAALELKGGNAVWTDNIINIQDAGKVGSDYGSTVDTDGDVNFDGVVNIQDLALVGGNFDLTSADAYGSWIP